MSNFTPRCVEPANVVAFYDFNEGSGTTAIDGVGNYDGMISNGTYIDSFGRNGKTIDFNGSNTNVNIGDVTELNSTAAFSIGFWFYQDVLDQADRIFWKYDDAFNSIQVYTTTNFNFGISNGSLAIGGFDYSTVISAQTWYRIMVVYDGSGATNADRLKIYVNGTVQTLGFAPGGATIPATTSNLAGITAYIGHTGNSLNGKLDNFTIWNKALTQAWVTKDLAKSVRRTRIRLI